MTPTYIYLIGIGSNLGNRRNFIDQALEQLAKRLGNILKISTILETPPLGPAADQPFLNGAILLASPKAPQDCLNILMEIEYALGRTRDVHWGNRTLDLDILLTRSSSNPSLEINTPDLVIPHPRFLERGFALIPAAEIAPDWLHPKTQKSLAEELRIRNFK